MSRISIINQNTITKRIRDYLLIGLAGLVIYKLPSALNFLGEKISYSSRISSVERYVKDNDFGAARELLEKFRESLTLKPEDISELEVKIETYKKKFDEEQERKKEQDLAVKIDDKKSAQESEIFEEIKSLIVPSIDFSSSRSLDDILLDLNGLFMFSYEETKISENLDRFYETLIKRKDFSVNDVIISEFNLLSRTYLFDRGKNYMLKATIGRDAYSAGTKVMVIKKVGEVINGERRYSWSETPSDIPLGTEGKYERDSHTGDQYHLIKIGDKNYWFAEDELITLQSFSNYFQPLHNIRNRINEIEDTLKTKQSQKDSVKLEEEKK